MNPRDAIQFMKSRTGAFLLFVILGIIAYVIIRGFQPAGFGTRAKIPERVSQTTKPQKVESITKDMTPFRLPQQLTAKPPVEPEKKSPPPKPLPPLGLFSETPKPSFKEAPLGTEFAPYGRLISCQSIITVDSSSLNTPIVGLVTEDIWHNGRLIIPVGTEVHGSAQVDRMRERIASQGQWTLVWQDGRELWISGIALDREKDANGDGWTITDGSAGMRGQLLKSDDYSEVKLFAATFLSGAAGAFTQREQTLLGSQPMATAQNAALSGTQQVLNAYAKQILDTIEREGFYVRVPAGKQFYLYVTQTMDISRASLGGIKQRAPDQAHQSP